MGLAAKDVEESAGLKGIEGLKRGSTGLGAGKCG